MASRFQPFHYYCFQFPQLCNDGGKKEMADLRRLGVEEVQFNGVWYYGYCTENTALMASLALNVSCKNIDEYV